MANVLGDSVEMKVWYDNGHSETTTIGELRAACADLTKEIARDVLRKDWTNVKGAARNLSIYAAILARNEELPDHDFNLREAGRYVETGNRHG